MTEKQQNNLVADPFDSVQAYEPPLKEHVRELRNRLIWCLGFLCGSFFVIATFFANDLMQLLTEPIKSRGIQFIYLAVPVAALPMTKVL